MEALAAVMGHPEVSLCALFCLLFSLGQGFSVKPYVVPVDQAGLKVRGLPLPLSLQCWD